MNLDTMYKSLLDAEKKAATIRQKLCAKLMDAAKKTDLSITTLQKVCGLSAASFHFRRKNLAFTNAEIAALIQVISAYDANIKQLTDAKKPAKNAAKKTAKNTGKTDEPGQADTITATDADQADEPDDEPTPEPGRATGGHHARRTL